MREIVDKYRNKELYDLSCSESIIYVFNEIYNFNLSENALKMFSPFSGGMYIEDKCGALTGALGVIGILFTNHVAHESNDLKPLTQEFIALFNKEFQDLNCDILKKLHRTEEQGCNPIIYKTVEILHEFIENNRDKITHDIGSHLGKH